MKCKLLRDMDGRNPDYNEEAALVSRANGVEYDVPRDCVRPLGTVIDHPDSWQLVQQGVAIPEDEECRAKANMTPAQMAAAVAAYDRLAKGRATGDKQYDAEPKKSPAKV